MKIETFYDDATATLTYIVYDEDSRDAVVIDPVLDYDPAASVYSMGSINKVVNYVEANQLALHFILETHAHADHLSGSQFIKKRFPNAQIAIGKQIKTVQNKFKQVFNFKDFNENAVHFDRLLNDNEMLQAGSLAIKVMFTPGHTPACSSYMVNDEAVFTGDVLFMHDYGTGRCDFPGGSAADMWESVVNRLYTLPDETKVFVGHDYKPGGREVQFESTIGQQKASNPQLNESTTKAEFVEMRESRDKTLTAPRLLLQSLHVNIHAGQLPMSEDNGVGYLKIPLKPSR